MLNVVNIRSCSHHVIIINSVLKSSCCLEVVLVKKGWHAIYKQLEKNISGIPVAISQSHIQLFCLIGCFSYISYF